MQTPCESCQHKKETGGSSYWCEIEHRYVRNIAVCPDHKPVYHFVKHNPTFEIELMEFNQAVVKASALAASMPSVVCKYEWDTFNLQEIMRKELTKSLKRYMRKESCPECKGVTLVFEGLTIFFPRHLSGSCSVHADGLFVPQNLLTSEEVKILNMSNLELAS